MPRIIDTHPFPQTEISSWGFYAGYATIFGTVFDDKTGSAHIDVYEHERIPLGEIFSQREKSLQEFGKLNGKLNELTQDESDFLSVLKSEEEHRQLKIIGDVGTGKTTFIRHLLDVHLNSKEFGGTHAIHLDWRGFTASITDPLPDIYKAFTNDVYQGFEQIFSREELKEVDLTVFEKAKLFARDRLALIYSDSDDLERDKLKKISEKMTSDPVEFAYARLNILCLDNPNNVVLIFDNIDQLDAVVLQYLLQFFIEIQTKTTALTVIAMRDHTDAQSTQQFSQYKKSAVIATWKMKLFPPDIRSLLHRRLEYFFPLNEKALPDIVQFGGIKAKLSRKQNISYCRTFINGLTNSEFTLDFLNRWSNYSVRTFFKVVQNILSFSGMEGRESGFINGEFSISRDDCLIALCLDSHKLYYSNKSSVLNLYSQVSNYSNVTPIVTTRVLQFSRTKGAMTVAEILESFKTWGFDKSLVMSSLQSAVNKDLFWSDTGDPDDLSDNSTLKISHRGDLYLDVIAELVFYNYLMSFSTQAPMEHSLLRDFRSETKNEINSFYKLDSMVDLEAVAMRVLSLAELIHEAEKAERKLIQSRHLVDEYNSIFGSYENTSKRILYGLSKLLGKVSSGTYQGRTLQEPSTGLMKEVDEKLNEYKKFLL